MNATPAAPPPSGEKPAPQKLLRSTVVVGLMTGVSRVFGLIRDVVLGVAFGPGAGMDAFIVAFRIPNFLRRLFAEGGFSQAFVPVLSEYRARCARREVQALVDHTAAVLALVLAFVTVAGILAAPLLVWVFAPGFAGDAEQHALTAGMLRVTFPYILFISLTALAWGILNAHRQFAVPAFTPVLFNLALIASAVWLAPWFPPEKRVTALAWGVLFAGLIQLVFQIPFLLRLKLLPLPRLGRDREGVNRIVTLMIPTLFAVSITQINLLVDTIIASFLETGSISWLYFSDRLFGFPLGVFGVALATVILPHLSAQHADRDGAAFNRTLNWALRWVCLISLPAALGLLLLAGPLLTTLFQYDEFTRYDAQMSARSLMAYMAGLPAVILVKVLSAAFFSRQDTKTPVRIGVIAMLSNVALNLILVFPLAHAGLALATSLAAWLNAALLLRALRRAQGFAPEPGWSVFFGRVGAGAAVLSLGLVWLVPGESVWFHWTVYDRALNIALFVAGGAVAYFAALRATGLSLRHPALRLAPAGGAGEREGEGV